MAKITQHIFNRKKLGSVLNNIPLESLADYAPVSDIKQKIENWRALIERNILAGKNEISLQDSFLSDFFGRILDYHFIHESPNEWHLYREKKTVSDASRSDAALGFFNAKSEDVRAVIELKDAKTNLDAKQKRKHANYTPVEQAFLYAGKFGRACKWIIVSNYREIRLYHRSASMNEYESFWIEKLNDEAELKRFLYLLSRKNLIEKDKDSAADCLYLSGEAEQEAITKGFYDKYKRLRLHLFEHLKQRNSDYDDLILLEKTQKMLDRFIFVCYCEDFGLLPQGIFRKMMEAASNPMMFADVSLWDQLKSLFRAIDQGSPPHHINKFNGGLFELDEILDRRLVIGDEIFGEFGEIADYDFDSELNVNVLGHIFEQSITDIEEIKAATAGESFDKKKGKRKKDGIFYTPEYITRYIVEQAVGGWLEDRKKELGFEQLPELTEKDFDSVKHYKKTGAVRSSNQNIKAHLEFWRCYKEKLSNIKVLDPACGSGAFLNQAFDYLYKEGQHVNEEIAKLQKGQTEVFRLDEHILKNNLFGVDLNPESVEITKLSLWLKTADKRYELTALDDNIKCGNSLIDDPEIAGDKAFKWEDEFAEIMKNGGFDAVIGNPPYARQVFNNLEKVFFSTHYKTAQYQPDLYILFIEKSVKLIQEYGFIGLITPNSWLKNMMMSECRLFMLNNLCFNSIIPNLSNVFPDASVDTLIFHAVKSKQDNLLEICNVKDGQIEVKHTIEQRRFLKNENYVFDVEVSNEILNIIGKVSATSLKLSEVTEISFGFRAYDAYAGQSKEIIKNKVYHAEYRKDESFKPFIHSKHIDRYFYKWDSKYFISYGNWLAAPRDKKFFEGERIVFREILGEKFVCTLISEDMKIDRSLYIALPIDKKENNIKYILALLASKFMAFYFRYKNNEFDKLFPKIRLTEFKALPIKIINEQAQQPFAEKAGIMLSKNRELHELKADFLNFVKSELAPQKISRKLENWHELDWEEFKTELAKCKAKIKELSLKERKEWQSYFAEQKENAAEIASVIENTDREIDLMVYELYGLTEEEIKIVENAA